MVINQAVKANYLLLLFSIIIGCNRSSGSAEGEAETLQEQPTALENVKKMSPESEDSFRQAALDGDKEKVNIFLEKGADQSLLDIDGDDEESFARRAGHVQVELITSTLFDNQINL
jgi:hypothetical protein